MDEKRYCVTCGQLLTYQHREEHPANAHGQLCLECFTQIYPVRNKRNPAIVPVKHCRKCGVLFIAWSNNVIMHAPCPA